MGIFEELSRITNLFADHFVSSKNTAFLRHVAFLPFDKTKLIEMDFLNCEVFPKEVSSKTFLKTIQHYREMIFFEIEHAGLDTSKINSIEVKLSYKLRNLSRYYTASVSIFYDGKEYTKSVLSSFS